jgi:acetoin utilization deacetylase AcuC-like enzyme
VSLSWKTTAGTIFHHFITGGSHTMNRSAESQPSQPHPLTGIFYHSSFSRRSYLTQGSRLQDFPDALRCLLEKSRYRLIESPAISEELILKVHTPQLIREVKEDPLCSTAWHSAGGVVMGAEMIASGRLHNAFAFIGAGGHHSGRDFFGGYCCFNDVAIAVQVLRERHSIRRVAILDTDAHHGDGTRALLRDDPDVLHVCMCSKSHESRDGTKVDVVAPCLSRFSPASEALDVNSRYLDAVDRTFSPRVRRFGPDFLFWYFGFDTHAGDYGDIGLTLPAYLQIAALMKALAEEQCDGRLEVVLGGGSQSTIARDLIPPVIRILGEGPQYENGLSQ